MEDIIAPSLRRMACNELGCGEFFQYFPEYAGRPVVPVFSSLYIPEEIVTYLTKHGIYAVGMGDGIQGVSTETLINLWLQEKLTTLA